MTVMRAPAEEAPHEDENESSRVEASAEAQAAVGRYHHHQSSSPCGTNQLLQKDENILYGNMKSLQYCLSLRVGTRKARIPLMSSFQFDTALNLLLVLRK